MSRAFRYHQNHHPRIFNEDELEGLEALGWRDNPGDAEKVTILPATTDPDLVPSLVTDDPELDDPNEPTTASPDDPTEEVPEPAEEPPGEDGEDSALDTEAEDVTREGSALEGSEENALSVEGDVAPEPEPKAPEPKAAPKKKGWPKGKKRK